jgi:CBS domain-containing protein
MTVRPGFVDGSQSVIDVARLMLGERRTAFPVVDRTGRVAGVVTLDAIQRVPAERRTTLTAKDVLIETPTVSPDDDLGRAMQLLAEHEVEEIPVVNGADASHLLGTISQLDIMRSLQLREFESQGHRPRRAHQSG